MNDAKVHDPGNAETSEMGSLADSKEARSRGREVHHLERAVELLWQHGHPRMGEALAEEVKALVAERDRLAAVLYPRVLDGGSDAA